MHSHTSLFGRRSLALVGASAAAALVLAGCSGSGSSGNDSADGGDPGTSFSIGINQLVQHPALDATAAGFKQAFVDAGYVEGETVTFDEQNANGEQGTALSIAQNFASSDLDLVFAIATPAAQATAQAVVEIPVVFSAVTDPEAAELVSSNDAPGGNVTGTSDMAQVADQLELLQELVPDAKTVGIVYASGEVNSEVQVNAATEAASELGLEIKTKTITSANEIQQATEALGDVDAIYVPTDNMVTAGLATLISTADEHSIPVIGAEAGQVEGGALATLGIDYEKLGYQSGEMALKILEDGADPAETPVEFAGEFTYVVNRGAADRLGIDVPESILGEAEVIE